MLIALTDIETTGLDPKIHEIIEIACILFDDEKFEIINTFEYKIKPEKIEAAAPEAMKVNGYNEEEWKDALSLDEVMDKYIEFTNGATFMAYNVTFDWGFLKETGKNFLLHYHRLDLLSMACIKIPREGKTSWSMKSVCKYLDIEPEPEIHRALNGVMKEYEIYTELSTCM